MESISWWKGDLKVEKFKMDRLWNSLQCRKDINGREFHHQEDKPLEIKTLMFTMHVKMFEQKMKQYLMQLPKIMFQWRFLFQTSMVCNVMFKMLYVSM